MGNCEQTSRREFAQIGLPGGFRKVCATRTFGLQGRFWAGGPGANLYCVWNRPRSLDRLAPLGIHLDLAGQLPAHDGPTHPDGQEQTERHKSQVGKGRRAVRLEDAPLGDEQPDESAEYARDQDRAAESERPPRRLEHHNPAREQEQSHQDLYRPDRRRAREKGRDGPVIERLARRVPGPVDQNEGEHDSTDEAEGAEAFMFHVAPVNSPFEPL